MASEFSEWLGSELLHRGFWEVRNSVLIHKPTGRNLLFWHDWTNPAMKKRRDTRNSVSFGYGPTVKLDKSEYRLIRDRAEQLKSDLSSNDYEELTQTPRPIANPSNQCR